MMEMTENKRFTFTQDTLAKADVFDGDEFVCCTLSVWVEQLVDKLNGLNDENEQLNKKLRIYKSDGLETLEKLQRCYENSKKAMKTIDALYEENEQLKHNNKMLSMKMSEVSTKYRLLKEFSEDTNPNEAVKTVLHELMMITKEYR